MFKSRHTIAISIIVLYFIPILFLSLYSLNSSSINKTWTLFSFGLFFGIAGSLILFLLMIQFETAVDSSRTHLDEDASPGDPLFEDDQPHLDFDTIIVNLNAELDSKKQEIKRLSNDNSDLNKLIEESRLQIQKSKNDQITESKIDEDFSDDESKPNTQSAKKLFEDSALDIETIEQSLYSRDNKVEVTRL